MDKFLEQVRTAVESIPQAGCPENAWAKFSAYHSVVAPPTLSVPYFIAAASVITILVSTLFYWVFETPKPNYNLNALEINCPCRPESISFQNLLYADNFSKPNLRHALTPTKPSNSNHKINSQTNTFDKILISSKSQKKSRSDNKKSNHSKVEQDSYGHELLISRSIQIENQNLKDAFQNSNHVLQNTSHLLTSLNPHNLVVDFENRENKSFDSLTLQFLNTQKRRRPSLYLEASAATILVQTEPQEPRVNNLMLSLGLNISKKFRFKTSFSLKYIRTKVNPSNTQLQRLNAVQRYRLNATDIEGQSIQVISQIDYIPIRWKSIAPFIGVGGGLNILETKEFKYDFKSFNINFQKYAKEDSELTPFLITLQAGVDIHLHHRLAFSLSVLYFRMLYNKEERHLLSGLSLKYGL